VCGGISVIFFSLYKTCFIKWLFIYFIFSLMLRIELRPLSDPPLSSTLRLRVWLVFSR
jgi:hypothetical protein